MEQLAPHDKIFVDPDVLTQDLNHGDIPCHRCHGGDPADPDWLTAHDGVVRDPSWPQPEAVCGDCHPDIVANTRTSLHHTVAPCLEVVQARAAKTPETRANVHSAVKSHCNACHASCGQCHLSRPTYVGGGLLDGHRFVRTPPWRETCTACHGSRVEMEYLGKNQGLPPDVHWRKRFMTCTDCHGAQEMHGTGVPAEHRYKVSNRPTCEQCHLSIYEEGAANREQHLEHRYKVSCQVCHSVAYKNCYGCHFALDECGFKYFQTRESVLDFKIGRNLDTTPLRPERFVTVRHVPVAPDSLAFYDEKGLANMDVAPTWKLATPHAIRRSTPQNADCDACHDDPALFLRPGDLRPDSVLANAKVAVPDAMLPAPVRDDVAAADDNPQGEGQ